MLSSPVRSIGDFSSAAGDVRLQIAGTRSGGAGQQTEVEREGLRTIHKLVDLGAKYAEPPDGNLDVSGSTPEQIDLAVSLRELIPGELEEIQSADSALNIPLWARTAAEILGELERGSAWEGLTAAQQEFVRIELEPFLKRLLERSPEEPQE